MSQYSKELLALVKTYKNTKIKHGDYKAVSLAMWLLESGRGKSKLALNHGNFSGIKYNSIITDYSKRITYKGSYYCEFENNADFIKGFWGYFDQESFKGWKEKTTALDFILHIAPIWSKDEKYTSKVINLLPEAAVLLNQAAVEVIETDDEIDTETEIPENPDTDIVTNPDNTGNADDNFLIPGRPSLVISTDKKKAEGKNGLEITYKGKDSCKYGITATKNKKDFEAIIIHHTSPKFSTEWYVKYQIDGDRARGGHFGYHFYISPEGKILQGAPLTKRTNHISPKSSVRKRIYIQNTNAIGITCVGAGLPQGFSPTNMQIAVAYDIIFALCDLYDIPFSEVHGHGEIQTNRHRSEGASISKEVRSWNEEEPPA